MSSKTVITCDVCLMEIGTGQVFFQCGVYADLDIHEACLTQLSAADLIMKLNLDDIRVIRLGSDTDVGKVNSYLRKVVARQQLDRITTRD